jgi:hypothetical protein
MTSDLSRVYDGCGESLLDASSCSRSCCWRHRGLVAAGIGLRGQVADSVEVSLPRIRKIPQPADM